MKDVPGSPKVYVTTSWDDGHKLDLQLAALLQKYHMPATFYIAPADQEFKPSELLKPSDVKKLSQHFEIGAHTMTHPRLPKIDKAAASREITESKEYLEKLIGKPVTSFCYPRGEYTAKHVASVKRAGFLYARTVAVDYCLQSSAPRLEAKTTIHTYSHLTHAWKIARFAKFNPIQCLRYLRWDNLAIAVFDQTLQRGGVYHIWGHSWEIEKFQQWTQLERVLAHIANRSGVQYVTNGQLA